MSIYWACCASGSNIRHSSGRCASSRTSTTPQILIEDKASGTQLIQELIADGWHGVRYQPTTALKERAGSLLVPIRLREGACIPGSFVRARFGASSADGVRFPDRSLVRDRSVAGSSRRLRLRGISDDYPQED